MALSAYRNLFFKLTKFITPAARAPPYGHICQVGDPVLREECCPIPVSDIESPHIKTASIVFDTAL